MGPVTAPTPAKAQRVPLLLTLGISGRALGVLPGVLATVAAFYLQAPLWATLPALVLFLVPLVAPRLPGTLSLLVAPLLLVSGLGLASFFTPQAVAPALLAFAATVPFFLHLGGQFPGRYLLLYGGLPALLLALTGHFLPDPWRLVVTGSDVATRAQVVVLIVAVALTHLIVRTVQGQRKPNLQ